MGFFDDDPFEDIVREFFGQGRGRTSSSGNVVSSEREERVIDYIDEDQFVYFVFELPGYSEKDIDVNVKGKELEISAIKEKAEGVQQYLAEKFKKGVYFRKAIPERVKVKKMESHFKNGILEVRFAKK